MALCKQYFGATDSEGYNLPFTMVFSIYESRTEEWIKIGEATVVPNEERFIYLEDGVTHKLVSHDESGWITPTDKIFDACTTEITFVYIEEQEQLCTPGARVCRGNDIYECNEYGTAYDEYIQTCPSGTHCINGTCVEDDDPFFGMDITTMVIGIVGVAATIIVVKELI